MVVVDVDVVLGGGMWVFGVAATIEHLNIILIMIMITSTKLNHLIFFSWKSPNR